MLRHQTQVRHQVSLNLHWPVSLVAPNPKVSNLTYNRFLTNKKERGINFLSLIPVVWLRNLPLGKDKQLPPAHAVVYYYCTQETYGYNTPDMNAQLPYLLSLLKFSGFDYKKTATLKRPFRLVPLNLQLSRQALVITNMSDSPEPFSWSGAHKCTHASLRAG